MKQRSGRRRDRWVLSAFLAAGLLSLVWFLIRVLPKPSRASYPCQRAALPLAGGFVAWLSGILVSSGMIHRGRRCFKQLRRPVACLWVGGAVGVALVAVVLTTGGRIRASTHTPNNPIGVAKGIHPGRVVWVHDPDATDWDGPGHGYWWEENHTIQAVVDAMMSTAIRRVAGEESDAAAWDALFRDFNQDHGKGGVEYVPGEDVMIKVNFVGCHYLWGGVDSTSYDLTSQKNYMNTSPQMIMALLRQLVYQAGVDPADISVGDPTALFPNQYYDICHVEFPEVHYLDHRGGNAGHPRTAVAFSSVPFFWSSHPVGVAQDYVPVSYAEAEYFIDLANFKSHVTAGVTFCAKNHFGSLIRRPTEPGYYNMHLSLAGTQPNEGSYRCLVDLLGHAHTGGKALLYLVDGLYSGVHGGDIVPRRWDCTPFDGDWTSSLFASQDPVALESVCFDLMQEEGDSRECPKMLGAHDHLHEAALADAPPSGTFYDPDHEAYVERLGSLGVHEHWDNPTDRQYTRNLGTGEGIELLQIGSMSGVRGGIDPLIPALAIGPNPFNPETGILVHLPEGSTVEVAIFDVRGRRVRSLVEQDWFSAGSHRIVWDGRDDQGIPSPSGTYLCRLVSDRFTEAAKMTLVK